MEVSDFGKYRSPPHNLIPSRERRAARGGATSYFATNNMIFICMYLRMKRNNPNWNFHAAPRRPIKPAGDDESCLALSLIKISHG
jgi:hypothetical protein